MIVMFNKLKIFFLTCFLIAGNGFVYAQITLETFPRPVVTQNSLPLLQEKLYINTDKPAYLCGEILWFKAYLTDVKNHLPLSLSKVLYVELINNDNKPVLQTKIALEDGVGDGSIQLPFSFETGKYVLRAYTNWMKNFPAENYFAKNITIVNTTKEDATAFSNNLVKPVISFFPEGGDLVNGLQSTVGFKLTGNYQKGIAGKGIITDENGDTVLHFQASLYGMGRFQFSPQTGKKYQAQVTTDNGEILTAMLPDALDKGYVMHLSELPQNKISITVYLNRSAGNSFQTEMSVWSNGNSASRKKLNFQNGHSEIIIDKNKLPEGISVFTIFDEQQKPMNERLYFKQPKNVMTITLDASKNNFSVRSKVYTEVTTTNNTGEKVPANLSASVYRLDEFTGSGEEDILSELWFRPYIRGFIENAGYYFGNDKTDVNAAADNLMLTQGWRKFEATIYTEKNTIVKFVPEYSGTLISGKVVTISDNSPAEGVMIYLSVPGKRIQTHASVSDKNGMVYFPMKDFYDKNQIVLQTDPNMAGKYRTEIASPFSEKFALVSAPVLQLKGEEIKDITENHLKMQVQEVYHDFNQFQKPVIDTVPFYYKPYKTYKLSDYTRFTTMEEVMREYVSEVSVRRSGSQYRLQTFNDAGFKLSSMQDAVVVFKDNPLVFLDGIPVFDINKIISYDPLKVSELDVIASRYHYGNLVADGILSYKTYSGNLDGFISDPGDIAMDYEGVQTKRIFYAPAYNTSQERSSRIPDFRSVLYWNPALYSGGNTNFSFFTGDWKGKYLVVIEGMSPTGMAGKSSFVINVAD